MSNNAAKHRNRIVDYDFRKDNPVYGFVFRDGSRLNLLADLASPRLEVVDPREHSFAKLFEKDTIKIEIDLAGFTFFFSDGSKLAMSIESKSPRDNLYRN